MIQSSSRREGFSAIPSVKWEDVGGLRSLRKEIDRHIVNRIKYPEDFEVIVTLVINHLVLLVDFEIGTKQFNAM